MRDPRAITREAAAALGAEAVVISNEGRYTAPSGAAVTIGHLVERAREGTVDHPPDLRVPLPATVNTAHTTSITVRNESTLEAARRLYEAALDPVALNFASGRHPGGGFLSGARAQEESLCRASALYACLVGSAMYDYHERLRDPLYSAWAIYSPGVPVFRDDDGALLERPWRCAFITAPAPNARVLRQRSPEREDAISHALAERVERVLAIAAQRGHRAIVLGAWGCGAFGCDSTVVAAHFERALVGPFHGAFDVVVFAILDTTPERRFIGPFAQRFGV